MILLSVDKVEAVGIPIFPIDSIIENIIIILFH